MTIEAVTVCVGYDDFLAETIKTNAQHFDRWVIVTSEKDKDTIALCHQNNLACIVTEDFYRDGVFNKGRAIQRGFNNLSCADWVLHVDADVALPRTFRQSLAMAHLDAAKVYGCDRMLVKNYEQWLQVKAGSYRQQGWHCYVQPYDNLPIGTRWASPADGYVPIGFFQLFNGRTSITRGFHQKPYLGHHSDAARSDVQFALQWDRRDRELLPELFVCHLESEPCPVGTNWKGRKSKRFGPESAGQPQRPY